MNPSHPLTALTTHYNDHPWLDDHAEALFDALSFALSQSPEDTTQAVDGLLRVYPYVISHSDVKKWSKLLQDALMTYERRNPPRKVETRSPVMHLFLISHEGDEVIEAEFNVAMRRARKRLRPLMIMEAYTNLLRLFAFNQGEHFDRRLITIALDLARQVNAPEAYARLHLSLAYLHGYQGEYDRMFTQGRSAYMHWQRLDHEKSLGLSAFAVGISLSRMDQIDIARPWLQRALDLFADSGRPDYFSYMAYEIGRAYFQHGDYAEAHIRAQQAVEQVALLQDATMQAVMQHLLGMAQARLGDYDAGRDSLQEALDHWQAQDNAEQSCRTWLALAELEARAGNIDRAHEQLNLCDQRLHTLPESTERSQLFDALHRLREAMHQGHDLTGL